MGLFNRKKKEKEETKKTSNKVEKTKTQAKVKESPKKQKKEKTKRPASKKPIYRVMYDKESRLWLIKKDGAKRTISSYVTKDEAMNRVKELSETKDMSFVVHKKDGKFQKK